MIFEKKTTKTMKNEGGLSKEKKVGSTLALAPPAATRTATQRS